MLCLAACSSTTASSAGPEDILDPVNISGRYSLSGSTVLVGSPAAQVRFSVLVTNLDASPEEVDYGGCSVFVRLFRTPDRSGAPIYDASRQHMGCTAELRRVSVAPRGSTTIEHYYDRGVFLSAGVSAGHYYVDLLVAPNASTVAIPAGEIDLRP